VDISIDFLNEKNRIKESLARVSREMVWDKCIFIWQEKEGEKTGDLSSRLMEELNCKTVFTIPIGKGIPVLESVVVTWIIMAALILVSIILTRNLRVENVSKRQLVLEAGIGFLQNFFNDILGEEGKRYAPYLITVVIYIGLANIIGIFGFTPPTKDMNMTAALAIMSIVLIEYAGFHKKGTKGWMKSFAEPVPVMLPINILEIFIRPVSLCMRLFGNVLGSFVVMELLKIVLPVLLPIPFSLYFDLFDGFIQAYVFVFLTALFIKEAIE
jgi:F-type H+-transporting ATPase subunit a